MVGGALNDGGSIFGYFGTLLQLVNEGKAVQDVHSKAVIIIMSKFPCYRFGRKTKRTIHF